MQAKVPVEKEIAATQTMSAYADCLKTLALRVRVCIASDFDAVGNLQLWDAPVYLQMNGTDLRMVDSAHPTNFL